MLLQCENNFHKAIKIIINASVSVFDKNNRFKSIAKHLLDHNGQPQFKEKNLKIVAISLIDILNNGDTVEKNNAELALNHILQENWINLIDKQEQLKYDISSAQWNQHQNKPKYH